LPGRRRRSRTSGAQTSGEVAKVLDFGLVRSLSPGATETAAQTVPGAVLGTGAYMSPEQRRGEAPAEGWDIWALALVAFETLTGAHPFTASSGSAAPSYDRGGYLVLRAGRRPLPAAGMAFFERALSIDPAHRPSSVVQLVEELDAAPGEAPEVGSPRPVRIPDV
jgi:serine/threonine-protein kinase